MANEPTSNPDQVEDAGAGEVREGYIRGNTFDVKKVYYLAVNGLAVFEGDIILGTVEQMDRIKQEVEDPNREEAVVITGSQFRWPNAVIPYDIDPSMPDQQRVADAINHLQNNTVLQLVARTTESNWVHFQDGSGCSSFVGMQGGSQAITLGTGCDWPRAVHEICHSAGLWHEQSREDRDTFVTIHWDNIQAVYAHNFDQHISDGDDVGPYDYGSIMHYGRHDFAINPANDTITPTPDPNVTIGQRNGLSSGDINGVNTIYPFKATLGDTSSNGPAFAQQNGQLLLGWTGTGNLQLNFMSSSDGLNFGNKVTLGDTSPNGLALTVFNGNYVVAWTGNGNNQLNVMQSADGINWGNKVTLDDTSLSSPALAVLANQLFLAWRGVGNDQLNVMRSPDGINFTDKVTLGDTSTSGPTLELFDNCLLIGWRGVGNDQLNVMKSSNGADFTDKVTLGDTTTSRPQLLMRGNQVFLTWQGVGNNFLNILSSLDGSTWVNKFTSKETCIDGPALAALGNNLVWGWTGTDSDHHLNTRLFSRV